MNSAVNCFTMPPETRFLPTLAGWILENYDTADYTKILILLPNRRSCLALREAFLDYTGGKPMLLPKIQPVGEIEEEILLAGLVSKNIELIQPINKVRRHFLLMRLIMRFQHSQTGGGNPKQASELVRQLVNFMDEVSREGLGYEGLGGLAPENLAGHWQQTLDFLKIITHLWPSILEGEGAVDVVDYRNRLLAALAAQWKSTPPNYPVIAAGSTGSQPATAELLKVIAGLPQGMVILPPLDKQMDGTQWKQIAETHPQYALKQLLEKIEIGREQVKWLNNDYKETAREKIIRNIFAPPLATTGWADVKLPDPQALDGIRLIEADTLLDEARAIAIAMRRNLEIPGMTTALVTPDRTLARMVSAQLKRFDITVDDSAGRPLDASAPASFLRLVVEMVASGAAPSALLALLRHPLAAGGIDTASCRRLSRELELLLLRGIRRESGINGLLRAAIANKDSSRELIALLKNLEQKSAPFLELFFAHRNASLKNLLAEHLEFAQWLATSDTQGGEERLWSGEAGNVLAEVIAQWNMQADILPPIDSMAYPALFDALLAPETYRPQAGLHPRLHILSPIEARLQDYDMVILSSLNEGVWPKISQPDPWMSRPQRSAFGLPSHQRIIGQSAYDFVMQLSAGEVLLTRARKVEGTPSIPSRWWVRLKTFIGGRIPEIFAAMDEGDYFNAAKNILDESIPINPFPIPSPMPPLTARPRKMRVTAVDNWLRDPYSIYARYILDLRKLDEIDREPDASDFGNIVHKALEEFTRLFPRDIPEDAYERLISCGRDAFIDYIDRPAVACLWWPRFVSMAAWFIGEEKIRRRLIENVYSEINASWKLTVDGREFLLSTRIDRLEKLRSGSYALVDYKTGTIPSKRDRESGLSNQLPLEALILTHGNMLDNISPAPVSSMEYWKLAGNEVKCEITVVESDIAETLKVLESLIRKFDDEKTPYSPQTEGILMRYNDYEHLVRRKEWETV